MDIRKKVSRICSALLMVLAVTFFLTPPNALSQATIPTRTPKPEPTEDDGGGGGGGDKPQPTDEPAPTAEPTQEPAPPTAVPPSPTAVPTLIVATEPPPPTPSATPLAVTETPFAVVPPGVDSTPTVTATAAYVELGGEVVAFPENNQPFPEAGPCALPPTFTSAGAMTAFAGPSADYPLAGLIGESEVRPIVGRDAFANWWIVQLDGTGRVGWVSDDLGTVHGYTGRVPIISAPDLDGVAPTPGSALWAPTPSAVCDAPELVVGAAVDQEARRFNVVPPSSNPDSVEDLYDSLEVKQPASGAAGGEQLGTKSTEAENLLNELAESAQPLEIPSTSTSAQQMPNLMPIAGFVLILAAVIVGLMARRGGSSSEVSD